MTLLPKINDIAANSDLSGRIVRVEGFVNYHKSASDKTQVVIHHTVGSSAQSAVSWWQMRNNKAGTVSTPYVIERNGVVYELFDPHYWSNHIGKKGLDECSIGIELVCAGGIKQGHIAMYDTVEYAKSFRGFKRFEAYTAAQIESLRLLLLHLCSRFDIPVDTVGIAQGYNVDDRALLGIPGIYSHAAYRVDKSDCHPQRELLDMLQGLPRSN